MFEYDYSQHPYCLHICFDEKLAYVETFLNGVRNPNKDSFKLTNEYYSKKGLSIVYDTTSGKIRETGWREFADPPTHNPKETSYVQNVLMELNDVYLRQQASIENVRDKAILRGVRLFLQQLTLIDDQNRVPYTYFYFAITIPTHWNDGIREHLIRPLFVRAGVLRDVDHFGKLLIFTQLESNFRLLQFFKQDQKKHVSIEQGKQFLMFKPTLVGNHCILALDIFSAHTSPIGITERFYTSKVIKSFRFTIPVDSIGIKYGKYQEFMMTMKENQYNNPDICALKSNFEALDDFTEKEREGEGEGKNKFQDSTKDERYSKIMLHAQLSRPYFKFLSQINNLLEQKIPPKYKSSNTTYISCPIDKDEFKNTFIHDFENSVQEYIIKHLGYRSTITFDFSEQTINNIRNGSKILIQQHLCDTNAHRAPSIISGNIEFDNWGDPIVSSIFKDNQPQYIVMIDILSDTIDIRSASINIKGEVKHCSRFTSNIKPLNYFFDSSSTNQRPVFQISKRLKCFMDENFGDILNISFGRMERSIKKNHIKVKRRDKSSKKKKTAEITEGMLEAEQNYFSSRYRSALKEARTNIDEYFSKKIKAMDEFFFASNEKSNVKANEKFVIISQPKYIQIFFMMYLSYLKNSIDRQLDDIFIDDWKDMNTGFVFSIEKMLLDSAVGYKNNLRDLLVGNGLLLPRFDEYQKTRIVTRGDGTLSEIERVLFLEIYLKSYCLIVQLHPTYIQLTLHQVVVPTRFRVEDLSTIIVKDKIISTKNIIDEICNHIWKYTRSNGQKITTCGCDLDSFSNFKTFIKKMNLHVSKLFSSMGTNFDMDCRIIDDDCGGCHISLSLRDIINIGLKPALQNIATIIASSLVDDEFFGSYNVRFLFIVEDMFKARYTTLHKAYTTILQRLIDSSVYIKERDTTAFILRQTINELMWPVSYMKSYMYNSFTTGIFHQASSATYGLSLKKGNIGSFSMYGHNQRSERITVTDEESTIVILKKGQLIPSTGLSCKLIVNLPSDTFEIELVRVTYSKNSPKEALFPKQMIRYSSHLETFSFPNHISRPTHLCLEITPANYNSSLEFSLRMLSYEEEYKSGFSLTRTVVLDEPLTLVHA